MSGQHFSVAHLCFQILHTACLKLGYELPESRMEPSGNQGMLLTFLSISALPSCHLWNPRYQLLEDKVCSPEHWFWVLLFLSCSHQHLELYYFIVAAVQSTHITPPSVLPFLGHSRFSCASPLNGLTLLITTSCSSYPPEIWFACVLLCWTQQGSGCLLKLPMGTNHRLQSRNFLAFQEGCVHILILRRVVCSRLIVVALLPAPPLILIHRLSS